MTKTITNMNFNINVNDTWNEDIVNIIIITFGRDAIKGCEIAEEDQKRMNVGNWIITANEQTWKSEEKGPVPTRPLCWVDI